jgi:hypothetical protein
MKTLLLVVVSNGAVVIRTIVFGVYVHHHTIHTKTIVQITMNHHRYTPDTKTRKERGAIMTVNRRRH